MKLTKIKLINWYHFDNADLDINDSVLLSGDNGCGKSTLLDAIQYVLTTEERFNKAANEKSSRKLDGYIRCKLGTEAQTYKRNESRVIAYVALEFFNEANSSTLVIGVRMNSPTEGTVQSSWFIKKDTTLSQIQFFEGKTPSYQLKDICDKNIIFEQTKTKAKEKILFCLGKLEDKFFELIHKALAFRPVDKVSEFINKFLLKENKIDVVELRKGINSIKQMEIAVKLTNEKIGMLKNIVDNDLLYKQYNEKKCISEVLLKQINAKIIDTSLAAYKDELKKYQILSNNYNLQAESKRQKSEDIAKKLAIINNETDMRAICSEEEALQRLNANIILIKADCGELSSQLDKLQKLCNKLNVDTKINNTLDNLENYPDKIAYLSEIYSKINKKIANAQDEKSNNSFRRRNLLELVKTNAEKIEKLQLKQFTYSPSVNKLKEAILDEFKERGISEKVHVFCELLKIEKTAWTNAVEGYLDKQRFNLIINPKYYKIAAMVYDRLDKNEVYGTGIVNIAKLKNQDILENSLATCVVAQNEFANTYLNHLLGEVVLCKDVNELQNYSKSITANCMKYSGHVLSRINYKIYETPFIGEEAIINQLKKCNQDKINYENEVKEIDIKIKAYVDIFNVNMEVDQNNIIKKVNIFSELNNACLEATDKKNYIESLKKERNFIEKDEEKIKLELEKCLAIKAYNEALGKSKEYGNKEALIEKDVQEAEDSLLAISQYVEQVRQDNYDCFLLAENQFNMLTPNKTAFNQRKNEANDFLKSVDSKIAAIVRDIENYQKAYVNAYNCEHSIGIEFTQKYINDYFTLVKYDIIDKEDKLVRVRQSCELQFKNDFLAKLKDSIEAAESQFQKLNKILKEVNYGNEKYKFDSNPSEDKSKLYEMIKADFNLGGNTLFSGDFEERYKDEIAYLFDKISTEESGNSKVLDEYSDYRNYLKYDIEITNENGKQFFSKICLEKSGGETQTPFYVIIAAAFCQIYSEQSIRLLMLDEAFDKMDDIRIQSMLKFFKVMKFQIILATPPAKMDVIAQFVESVFILKKIGASGVIYDIKHYLEE